MEFERFLYGHHYRVLSTNAKPYHMNIMWWGGALDVRRCDEVWTVRMVSGPGNNGNKELKLQKLGQLHPQLVLGKPLTEQAYNRTAKSVTKLFQHSLWCGHERLEKNRKTE